MCHVGSLCPFYTHPNMLTHRRTHTHMHTHALERVIFAVSVSRIFRLRCIFSTILLDNAPLCGTLPSLFSTLSLCLCLCVLPSLSFACHVPHRERIKRRIQKYLQQFITTLLIVHFGIFCCHLTNLPPVYCPSSHSAPVDCVFRQSGVCRLSVGVAGSGSRAESRRVLLCSINISLALYLCQASNFPTPFTVNRRRTHTPTHLHAHTNTHTRNISGIILTTDVLITRPGDLPVGAAFINCHVIYYDSIA